MNDDEITQPSVMPPQPTTKEIPAPTAVEIGIAKLNATIAANHEVVMHTFGLVQGRLSALEVWRGEQDTRSSRASDGVRGLSQSDASQDAKLAQALAELAEEKRLREDLQKNAATKEDLKTITAAQTSTFAKLIGDAAKTPIGKKVLIGLGGLALAAINVGTVLIATKGHHDAPQFAPPAVVFIGPDGGVLPR